MQSSQEDMEARLFHDGTAIASEALDKQHQIAALQKIAPMESLTHRADPEAVEVGTVGAA